MAGPDGRGGGFCQGSSSPVLIVGVKAAEWSVLGRFRERTSVHHLPDQHGPLSNDGLRLPLEQ